MAGTPSTAAWVHFRANAAPSGFPGDGAGNVYNLGESESGLAGARKIAGVYGQGWGSAPTNATDDSTYNTAHIAGYNSSTSRLTANMFHIGNLSVGHTYRLWLAMAAFQSTASTGVGIMKDTSETYISGGDVPGTSVAAGSIMDIGGNVHTSAANWLSAQSYLDYTATTADLFFARSSSFASAYLNAIGIEDLTVISPSAGATLSMMGV